MMGRTESPRSQGKWRLAGNQVDLYIHRPMKKAAWIVGVVLFALVSLAILKFMPEIGAVESSSFPPRKPIATAKFEDDSEFQILQIGVGSLEDGRFRASSSPPKRFNLKALPTAPEKQRDSTSDLSIYRVHENHGLIGFYADSKYRNLLLETRCLNHDSKPLHVRRVHVAGKVIGSGVLEDVEFLDSAAMAKAGDNVSELPEIVVQIADGQGGWITGDGPIAVEDDSEGRGCVSFPIWPRQLSTLTFRVLRPGAAVVEMHLSNPKPAQLMNWLCDARAARRDEADFSLRLEQCEIHPREGQLSHLMVSPKLVSKLQRSESEGQWVMQPKFLTDNVGNVSPVLGTEKSGWQFRVSPSSTQFKLRCQICWEQKRSPDQGVSMGVFTPIPDKIVDLYFDRSWIKE